MSTSSTFAAVIAASVLTISLAPAASAATYGSATAAAPVPSDISPKDYANFQSGVAAHAYQMDGAQKQFTMSANNLRDLAKEIEPLIGKQDEQSQAALKAQIDTVNNHITTMKAVSAANQKMFNKACDRFLKMYVPKWTTPKEKDKVKKNVEAMRDSFNELFTQNYDTLIVAATALANQDVKGFWDALAIAEGSVAFNVHRFEKANRNLMNMPA